MAKDHLFFASPENLRTFGQNVRKISCLGYLIWRSESFIVVFDGHWNNRVGVGNEGGSSVVGVVSG